MRLIDADALKQECMYIDDIPAVTERDIHNAPTIDAIPVEWLRNVHKNCILTRDDMEFRDWLIKRWQKEQEADLAQKLGIEPKEG